ncbi:hypothetical protein Tco_1034607 [Tanacetum coccineum]
MHVEKNVAESLVKTLLHVTRKAKDGVNDRLDLTELGVKPELFAMQEEDKTTLPPTGYTLTNDEKDTFCETKEIILQELDKMQAEVVVILCLLEKFFPPSFDCAPNYGGHAQNRNRPEGCIAEETIMEETIEFFSEYHKSMETIGIPPDKQETYENEEGKPLSTGKSSEVSTELFQKAHLYVIQNTNELVLYIERHKQVLKTENPGKRIAFLENEHSKSFAKWLRKEISTRTMAGFGVQNQDAKVVACGSKDKVEAYRSRAKLQASTKDSSDDNNGPSIPRVLVYGPTVQGLLDTYGYDNIEDYLSDFYFPSTDKEDTIMHTGQDPIHECHSPKSNAKYVPVSHKHKPNVKSPNEITGCVLGPLNVDTWYDILNKFGMRTPGRCADNWMNDSLDDSKDVSSKGPSITSIPKEGPSTAKLSKEPIPKELLTWYVYDIIEDYLPVIEKPIPKVIFKSHIPIKRCVLRLANVETWDNIVKKYGMRTPGRCTDKSNGKRKVSC